MLKTFLRKKGKYVYLKFTNIPILTYMAGTWTWAKAGNNRVMAGRIYKIFQ
jgi:hypothetical protein